LLGLGEGNVAHGNREIAHVDVARGMDVPLIAAVAARFHVPGEQRRIGAQYFDGAAPGVVAKARERFDKVMGVANDQDYDAEDSSEDQRMRRL